MCTCVQVSLRQVGDVVGNEVEGGRGHWVLFILFIKAWLGSLFLFNIWLCVYSEVS